MRAQHSRALVLSRVNYGEADRIITCLLEEGGKQSFMVKGARKLKSKMAGGIEPMAINELGYIKGKGNLAIASSARMLKNFDSIKTDLDKTQAAYGLIKWTSNYLEEGSGQEYYPVLESTFQLMNSPKHYKQAVCFFYVKAISLSGQGIELRLDASGQPLNADLRYTFDIDQMAFAPAPSGRYSADDIKFLRLCFSLDLAEYAKITIPADVVDRSESLVKTIVNSY